MLSRIELKKCLRSKVSILEVTSFNLMISAISTRVYYSFFNFWCGYYSRAGTIWGLVNREGYYSFYHFRCGYYSRACTCTNCKITVIITWMSKCFTIRLLYFPRNFSWHTMRHVPLLQIWYILYSVTCNLIWWNFRQIFFQCWSN